MLKPINKEGEKNAHNIKWPYTRSKHEYTLTRWIAYTILQTTQALSTFIVIILEMGNRSDSTTGFFTSALISLTDISNG